MITDQFIAYVDQMEQRDADVMSEFLVMAATLLDIKAKMLLPKEIDEEGNEEDPRAELVEQLLEYKLYKYMSFELKDKELNAAKFIYKKPSIPAEVEEYEAPVDLDRFLENVTLERIRAVFDDVMARSADKINEAAMKFGRIEKEEIKTSDRIEYIRSKVKTGTKISFRELISSQRSKMNIIVTFLAVLEMMKTGELKARQEGSDDILLYSPEIEDEQDQD
ncbi:MAG: segregation/condensation protein A [Lachnospiraceae bacterium]|nr:segregation/condensation protein A [Lachnospiraceae bacterium]MBR6350085.1 segregation/condensation protein A [Lachnospiraceae bacterium]